MPDYLRKHGPAERVTYGTTAASRRRGQLVAIAAGAVGRVKLYH